MEAYTSFAKVYDIFMDNVPYEEWSLYLIHLLKEYGVASGIVAELGCGTGNMTRLLRQAGYDMIGIDSSADMLGIAREKETENPAAPDIKKAGGSPALHEILYLLQDMREFELYGTVAAVVSVCDCINYITEPEELIQVFCLVSNYLDPQGIFIFDFHPEGYYSRVLADNTFAEDREDMSFIWENEYDSDSRQNIYDLSIFVCGADGRYDKFQETHYQRSYDLAEMKAMIEASGLEYVAMYDAFTKEPAKEESQRVYVIARECKKGRVKAER